MRSGRANAVVAVIKQAIIVPRVFITNPLLVIAPLDWRAATSHGFPPESRLSVLSVANSLAQASARGAQNKRAPGTHGNHHAAAKGAKLAVLCLAILIRKRPRPGRNHYASLL